MSKQQMTIIPPDDAAEIGKLYRLARTSLVKSVQYAIERGQKLIAKKAGLKHGEWLPWLEQNAETLDMNVKSTPQRLMKLASNSALAQNLDETTAITVSRKLWGHDNVRGMQGTGENEWYTPADIIANARAEKSGYVETVATAIDTEGRKQPAPKPAKTKRRDIEDYIAEKNAKTATKVADAPGLAPQQTDIEECIAQCDEKSSAVQRILDAIEKLDDQQLAELKAALQQQWPSGLGVRVENVSGQMPDIPEFLRRRQ